MIIEGIFTTRSPLSHISETISIGSLLNERPIIQGNGEMQDVFCYNGNAWRGQLRDNMALFLVEKTGIKELSTEKHNFLFSGGKIGGASAFKLAEIRNHFELLPHFSLFGGCLSNMMLPGKVSFFDSLPLCQEAITELPQHMHNKAVERTYRRMTVERLFTRTDDSKNMKLNQSLKITPNEEREKIQMRAGGELLNSGVELFNRSLGHDASDLEVGALCSALVLFSDYSFIGGQHNKGHGLVDLNYEVDGKAFFSVKDFKMTTGEYFNRCLGVYNQHLEDKKEQIKELLL